MSGLKDLRKIFGIYDCEDHDVIDVALDRISEQERASEEKYLLSKGREVHRITLTKSVPAAVVKAELNIPLEHDVELSKFNNLDSADYQFPGAWFVRQGFIVRSKKENGYWVQYAFKSFGANNLTRSEVMEYLDVARLEYDPYTIVEFGPTVVFCLHL
ncbi:hypothetical protein [uncultured Porticoccus sp.]|uniref:hypothetical protein n=1 Tax=uncultured Porticoccus sp. TaxID=1256050 RepID=UPI0030DAE107|tara:strand:- start:1671 stop:2144 length:474 start_codon:yes stop_codon:yes gene_type:complete